MVAVLVLFVAFALAVRLLWSAAPRIWDSQPYGYRLAASGFLIGEGGWLYFLHAVV